MQTLCGIAHYDFRLHKAYSYEQAFNVMRALRLPYPAAEEMFRRMVFNVVVRNQDDHTKNISFLMDADGKWRLSPAYDMGYAYNPKGGWTATHQMSIHGKFDDIKRGNLLTFALQNNIKNPDWIINTICEQASHWREMAKDCGVPSALTEVIIQNMLLEI
jgi:serine/threonine-protein kinase HipA